MRLKKHPRIRDFVRSKKVVYTVEQFLCNHTFAYDARSEGASVHEKRQKKVWFFRPIDVFNLGFFRSDNLVIWTVYAILAREDSHFFLDFMVLSNGNTLFEKDYCTKKPHFFLPEIEAPSDRASHSSLKKL